MLEKHTQFYTEPPSETPIPDFGVESEPPSATCGVMVGGDPDAPHLAFWSMAAGGVLALLTVFASVLWPAC